MTHRPAHSITGKRIMIDNETGKFFVSLAEDSRFCYVMCDISTFVADNYAWDMFYDVWQQAAESAGMDDAIIAGDSRY